MQLVRAKVLGWNYWHLLLGNGWLIDHGVFVNCDI